MESITKYAITGAISFLVGGVIGYFIHKPKEVPQVHDNTITIINTDTTSKIVSSI